MSTNTISIALEGMKFYAFHGVYEEEHKIGRNFTVSVYVDYLATMDGSDKLEETYNYEWIYEVTSEQMKMRRKLLETVAYFIGKELKAKSNKVTGGKISISKEALVLGGEVERSIIEYRF